MDTGLGDELVRGDRGYRRLLLALLLGGFATFAQLYSAQAALPVIVREMDISAAQSTQLITVGTMGVAVGVLPWAAIGVRFGHSAALKVSIVLSATLGFATPLMPTWDLVLLSRGLDGLALAGVPALASALIAERIHVKWLAVVAGTYVAGNTIGGLFGRLLAGFVADIAGWRVSVAAVAFLCAAASVGFVFLLEGRPDPDGRYRYGRPTFFAGLSFAVARLELWGLYAQPFFAMGALVAVYNYLPFVLEAPPYSLPLVAASSLFSVYLAGTVSSRMSGRFVQRFGSRTALLGSLGLMLSGLMLMLVPSLVLITIGLTIFTAGYFAAIPVSTAWLMLRSHGHREQSGAMFQLFLYCGAGLWGLSLGGLYTVGGWAMLVTGTAICCLLAMALSALVRSPRDRPSSTLA